jgi:hypothetical protein
MTKKAPSQKLKRSLGNPQKWGVKHKFPFSKEGGAVSGDTRRLHAIRIFPC